MSSPQEVSARRAYRFLRWVKWESVYEMLVESTYIMDLILMLFCIHILLNYICHTRIFSAQKPIRISIKKCRTQDY